MSSTLEKNEHFPMSAELVLISFSLRGLRYFSCCAGEVDCFLAEACEIGKHCIAAGFVGGEVTVKFVEAGGKAFFYGQVTALNPCSHDLDKVVLEAYDYLTGCKHIKYNTASLNIKNNSYCCSFSTLAQIEEGRQALLR